MKAGCVFFLTAWFLGSCTAIGLALDLSKVKAYFLNGDYKAAITEGEKMLSETEETPQLDELYYLLGLSYLKDGNFLRASDIFEIILNEFEASALKDEATMGLGDAYFLKQDFQKARAYYRQLLGSAKDNSLMPSAYYRLSQCALKEGNTQEAQGYLTIIKEKYPGYAQTDTDELVSPVIADFYTVQVGSFSKKTNAGMMAQKLIAQGFPAYTEESGSPGATAYRVRVGKFTRRQEAEDARLKLSQAGYPARVFP